MSEQLEVAFRLDEVEDKLARDLEIHGKRSGTHLVDLDARVLADDTGSRARAIEQHPVKPTHNLGEHPSIIMTNNDILASQSMNIRRQTLHPRLITIIRKHRSGILHQRTEVRALPTGRTSHIEHALARLRRKCDARQEGRSGLQHVMSCEVLGRRADWHAGLEDLQADFGPWSDGLEVYASIDERLCQVAAACAERVGADRDWARRVVCFEEFNGLPEGETMISFHTNQAKKREGHSPQLA